MDLMDPRLELINGSGTFSDGKVLRTFAGRIRYCDSILSKIKAGSARIVYDFDSTSVLKLAKNEKGLYQNATEADGLLQSNYKNIVANVLDSDPQNWWVRSEKAFKINESAFKTLSGFEFKEFCNYVRNKFTLYNRSSLPVQDPEKYHNDPWVQYIIEMMVNFNMPAGDICRINSWGKTSSGSSPRLVLLDYGLTQDIFERFYRK